MEFPFSLFFSSNSRHFISLPLWFFSHKYFYLFCSLSKLNRPAHWWYGKLGLAKDTFWWLNADCQRTPTRQIHYKSNSSQPMNYTKVPPPGRGEFQKKTPTSANDHQKAAIGSHQLQLGERAWVVWKPPVPSRRSAYHRLSSLGKQLQDGGEWAGGLLGSTLGATPVRGKGGGGEGGREGREGREGKGQD